jgi:hypothetical protein
MRVKADRFQACLPGRAPPLTKPLQIGYPAFTARMFRWKYGGSPACESQTNPDEPSGEKENRCLWLSSSSPRMFRSGPFPFLWVRASCSGSCGTCITSQSAKRPLVISFRASISVIWAAPGAQERSIAPMLQSRLPARLRRRQTPPPASPSRERSCSLLRPCPRVER